MHGLPELGERRRTKIVATVGPASRDPETLHRLIVAGVDVFRLNFAHGNASQHAEMIESIRAAAERAEAEVGLLGDLPGPKLRLGELRGGLVELSEGSEVTLTADGPPGDSERLPVASRTIAEAIGAGDQIYLADGRLRLLVLDRVGDDLRCLVEIGGAVASHQGINVPGGASSPPATNARDMDWLEFAVEHGIDMLAVSFVRGAADLEPLHQRLDELDADVPLIAKIEKPQAAARAEEVIAAADGGIMVARGDLGIELPVETVPVTQKRLIRLAGRLSKPVITATQMLASMTTSDRPTRAEVTDVANAIYDGTDAVMLSEETAIGEHPVEAVRVMDRIARETELDLPYEEWLFHRTAGEHADVADSVAQGAVAATYRLGLAAIVVPTTSGRTARLVSAHRPRVPILAISTRIGTVRRMELLFGVRSALAEEPDGLMALLDDCARLAAEHGVAAPGDLIAITAGIPSQGLGTNLFEVHRVPGVLD